MKNLFVGCRAWNFKVCSTLKVMSYDSLTHNFYPRLAGFKRRIYSCFIQLALVITAKSLFGSSFIHLSLVSSERDAAQMLTYGERSERRAAKKERKQSNLSLMKVIFLHCHRMKAKERERDDTKKLCFFLSWMSFFVVEHAESEREKSGKYN